MEQKREVELEWDGRHRKVCRDLHMRWQLCWFEITVFLTNHDDKMRTGRLVAAWDNPKGSKAMTAIKPMIPPGETVEIKMVTEGRDDVWWTDHDPDFNIIDGPRYEDN